MSIHKVEESWPPKSPHEALLSSPSGRRKVQRYYDRSSPSPSPLRRAGAARSVLSALDDGDRNGRRPFDTSKEKTEEEDDEETLQLKLQALEARIKLKRLQQRKASNQQSDHQKVVTERIEAVKYQSNHQSLDAGARANDSRDLQVSASPKEQKSNAPEQRSPGRILLGIDKGLKARNVSLRRVPQRQTPGEDPFHSRAVAPSRILSNDQNLAQGQSGQPTMTFSEQIARIRRDDKEQQRRQEEKLSRPKASFVVDKAEIEKFQSSTTEASKNSATVSMMHDTAKDAGFSRSDVIKALNGADRGVVPRSQSTGNRREGSSVKKAWKNPNIEMPVSIEKPKSRGNIPVRSQTNHIKTQSNASEAVEPSEKQDCKSTARQPTFEPFSTTNLSKRLIPQEMLTRNFLDKSVLRIPDLLADVKGPDFRIPETWNDDYVIMATIASKSEPLTRKNPGKPLSQKTDEHSEANAIQTYPTSYEEADASVQNSGNRASFMALTLTDLKWTLDLYLFNTAYTRYYKLTPGTVIAILNPGIMPPRRHKTDTGRFSLTLHSSDDTVLEVGTSRDLGWCRSTCRDGKKCSAWVDKRHTNYCEFHVDKAVERNRRSRMETQGLSAPFAPGGKRGGRTGFFGTKSSNNTFSSDHDPYSDHPGGRRNQAQSGNYDRATSARYFIAPTMTGPSTQSTASLLDAEDTLCLTTRGETRAECERKRMANQEREDELARQLSARNNGAGSEYLRLRHEAASSAPGSSQVITYQGQHSDGGQPLSHGLRTNKASAVHLSPLKGLKRRATQASTGGDEGAGSPRKKTRFVTPRGIKIAGRDSLPGQDIDDNDDLEIE